MKAVKVELEYHWGFSIRRPYLSASEPSLKIIPPTSLIGALSRGLAYLNGWSEVVERENKYYSSAIRILNKCKWATMALKGTFLPGIGLVETRDILRAVIAHYQRRENIEPGAVMFAPQLHGRVYAPSLRVCAVYIVEDDYLTEVSRATWGILALGCKESLVSVEDVKVVGLEESKERIVETRFLFERKLIKSVKRGDYMEDTGSIPTPLHYQLASVKREATTYILPLRRIEVEVATEGLVLKDEEGDKYIVSERFLKGG